MRSQAVDRGDKEAQSSIRLTNIVASLCSLRAEVAANPGKISSEAILGRALAINDGFLEWQADMPAEHCYRSLPLSEPDDAVHTDYYYAWSHLGHAMMQTSYWMTAILLHGLIIQRLDTLCRDRFPGSRDPEYYASQIQESAKMILVFIDHICASVHYHFSMCTPTSKHHNPSDSETWLLPSASAVMAILKPLFVAGDSKFCPLQTRAWIIDQLKVLGLKMGIRQALFLADIMLERREITDLLLRDT